MHSFGEKIFFLANPTQFICHFPLDGAYIKFNDKKLYTFTNTLYVCTSIGLHYAFLSHIPWQRDKKVVSTLWLYVL